MLLRPAGKNDADILTKLHEECFVNYWDINQFNDFFSVDNTFALIAETPAPVGMIIYRVAHEQADIITIAVLPARRRQSIARVLLERALSHIADLGAKTLFLDVEDGNEPARKLYETHGFSIAKRRKHYYRQKDGSFTDALVMNRKFP